MARQRPPAASWRAGRGRAFQALLALVFLGALGNVALFGLIQASSPIAWLILALLLACIAVSALALRRTPLGTLRWDGESWHWSAIDTLPLRRLRCVFDGQRILLLHAQTQAGQTIWLWLESPQMSAPWLALRRAVVATATEASTPLSDPDR